MRSFHSHAVAVKLFVLLLSASTSTVHSHNLVMHLSVAGMSLGKTYASEQESHGFVQEKSWMMQQVLLHYRRLVVLSVRGWRVA